MPLSSHLLIPLTFDESIHNPKMGIKILSKVIQILFAISPFLASKVVYFLFTHPISSTPKKWMVDFLAEADQIDLKEVESPIYHWSGKGPSILLMHGWKSNAARWKRLIRLLQKQDFNIYAIDAPRHGRNKNSGFTPVQYAQDAAGTIAHFNIKHVVGHSVGGYSMLYLFSRHPHLNIKKGVAMAPTFEMKQPLTVLYEMTGMNAKAQAHYEQYVERQHGDAIDEVSAVKLIQHCSIPTLIIHDQEDDVLKYSNSITLHKAWPSSTLITTQGHGHRMQSNEVYDLIINYLIKP